jgi:hypothetical protein
MDWAPNFWDDVRQVFTVDLDKCRSHRTSRAKIGALETIAYGCCIDSYSPDQSKGFKQDRSYAQLEALERCFGPMQTRCRDQE